METSLKVSDFLTTLQCRWGYVNESAEHNTVSHIDRCDSREFEMPDSAHRHALSAETD